MAGSNPKGEIYINFFSKNPINQWRKLRKEKFGHVSGEDKLRPLRHEMLIHNNYTQCKEMCTDNTDMVP